MNPKIRGLHLLEKVLLRTAFKRRANIEADRVRKSKTWIKVPMVKTAKDTQGLLVAKV